MGRPTSNDVSSWAPYYAELGYRPISIHGGAKIPVRKGWPQWATNDIKTVQMEFPTGCVSNVGIAGGEGLVIVDIDTSPGIDHGALLHWLGVADAAASAPMATTPRGGQHVYFRVEGQGLNNRVALFPGVDLRSRGGQVVAPPSRTLAGEKTVDGAYEWVRHLVPIDQLQAIPVALLPSTAASSALGRLAAAAKGTRNPTLNNVACDLGVLARSLKLVAGGRQIGGVDDQMELAATWMRAVVESLASWGDKGRDGIVATIKSGLSAARERKVNHLSGGVARDAADDAGVTQKPAKKPATTTADVFEAMDAAGAHIVVDQFGMIHLCVMSREPGKEDLFVVTDGLDGVRGQLRLICNDAGIQAGKHVLFAVTDEIVAWKEHNKYPIRKISSRVQAVGDSIVYDDGERGIEVTKDGVRPYAGEPLLWRRGTSFMPAPVDLSACCWDLRKLFDVVNIPEATGKTAALAWLVASMQPDTSKAILSISGQEGSCKTTAARLFRDIVDPRSSDVGNGVSDSIDDIYVVALSRWVCTFDNVSDITKKQSDALCGIATGGTKDKRTLFTDSGETVICVKRPVVVTGISDFWSRPDALSRLVRLDLAPPEVRRTESDVNAAVDALLPKLRGALLQCVSSALFNLGRIDVSQCRLADACAFAGAGLIDLEIGPGEVIEAFQGSHKRAMADLIGTTPLIQTIIDKVAPREEDGPRVAPREIRGRATQLRKQLAVGVDDRELATWPDDDRAFARMLKRSEGVLRDAGVIVTRVVPHNGRGTEIVLTGAGGEQYEPASFDAKGDA